MSLYHELAMLSEPRNWQHGEYIGDERNRELDQPIQQTCKEAAALILRLQQLVRAMHNAWHDHEQPWTGSRVPEEWRELYEDTAL